MIKEMRERGIEGYLILEKGDFFIMRENLICLPNTGMLFTMMILIQIAAKTATPGFDCCCLLTFVNLFETALLTTVKEAELATNRRDNVGIGVSIHNFESKSNNMSLLERRLLPCWRHGVSERISKLSLKLEIEGNLIFKAGNLGANFNWDWLILGKNLTLNIGKIGMHGPPSLF